MWPKFENPLSRTNYFDEILLEVAEHKYIHIFKIKFEKKKNVPFQNGGQNEFLVIAQ